MIKVFYRKEVFWKFTLTVRLDIITLQFNLMMNWINLVPSQGNYNTYPYWNYVSFKYQEYTDLFPHIIELLAFTESHLNIFDDRDCFFFLLLLFFDVYCLKHSKHTTTHTGWWKIMRKYSSIWIQVSLTNMTKYYKP